MRALEEAYRLCALEHYSTESLRAGQDVQIVENGAWVTMQMFIPDWVLGRGYRVTMQEGKFLLYDPSNPEDTLTGESLDDLFL